MKNSWAHKINYFHIKIIFIFLFFISLTAGLLHAQTKPKTAPQKTTYAINDKPVDKLVFDKLYHSLIEIKGTWHCGETTHGGETGFQGKTKNGTVYEYLMISEKSHNSASIDKVK